METSSVTCTNSIAIVTCPKSSLFFSFSVEKLILATVKKQIVVLGPYFGQKVVQNSSVLDD